MLLLLSYMYFDLVERLIWTPTYVSFQSMTDDKISRKSKFTIKFGNATYHHVAYVANIIDPFILYFIIQLAMLIRLEIKYNYWKQNINI